MSTSLSRREFLSSKEADSLREELQKMVDDPQYNTIVRYSTLTNSSKSEFVQKHMEYMSKYPTMKHTQYVSNLRLMTKLKS